MTQQEMQEKIKFLEERTELLAEALANHAHFMHLMARQVRLMAHEMDVNIEPPRMNS